MVAVAFFPVTAEFTKSSWPARVLDRIGHEIWMMDLDRILNQGDPGRIKHPRANDDLIETVPGPFIPVIVSSRI